VSVCLSQVGVLLKRLEVGSRKQRRTIAQRRDSIFLMPKTLENSSGFTPAEAPHAGGAG